ncbi:uncharacterized protein B0H64DRAFT_385391 [Chaetomium fimeti]|jgi:hypothetical protein|uniref:Mitochondrial pyruvate carrier n=1 Tax=Chaetomium fimeti TaxID=1854472 RepID=A0AAE0HL05_9PEZI|nr:hypothetical protein B0H64DRAFT_385391 [Chaetomium fimeti]
MSPSSNFFRAARPAFRARQFFFRPKQGARFQSTTADAAADSWAKRMWNSPVGLKTVHFWAPVMKWALVLAGVSDFARPAEKLSLTQNAALTSTGLIWTRWCLIIKPKNYLLAAVNFFLGVVGVVQCSRIIMWQQSQKGLPEKVEEVKEAVVKS